MMLGLWVKRIVLPCHTASLIAGLLTTALYVCGVVCCGVHVYLLVTIIEWVVSTNDCCLERAYWSCDRATERQQIGREYAGRGNLGHTHPMSCLMMKGHEYKHAYSHMHSYS